MGPCLPPGLVPHCPAPGQPAPNMHIGPGVVSAAGARRQPMAALLPGLVAAVPRAMALPLPSWIPAFSLGDIPEGRAQEMSAREKRSVSALVLQPCSPWMNRRSPARRNTQG